MPPVKKKSEVTKIKVSNTEITLGNVFEVIEKRDLDSPAPINGEGTVKYTTPGNGEIRSIVYDETMRRWDTGFEVLSACNKGMPLEGKEAAIKVFEEYIKKPYEEFYMIDASATNNPFWDEYHYEVYVGKTFDTSKPTDLFDLFHALKQGTLCEKGEKDATLQRSAIYCIRNREQSVSREDEKLLLKADAIGTLAVLVDATSEDNDTLYTILEWIQFSNVRGAEKEPLKKMVLKSFEAAKTGNQTVERFMEAFKMTKKEETKHEMELFSILNKLNIKRKLEYKRSQYYLEDQLLGNSLKAAAKTASMNPEIKELIISNYEKV